MATASYPVCDCVCVCVSRSHISSNLVGRKLTNATLLLVSIAIQLYPFLKKTGRQAVFILFWWLSLFNNNNMKNMNERIIFTKVTLFQLQFYNNC